MFWKQCRVPPRDEDERALGRIEDLFVGLEAEVALEHPPHLVLAAVDVERRTLARRHHVLEQGEGAACVPGVSLDDGRSADRSTDRLPAAR